MLSPRQTILWISVPFLIAAIGYRIRSQIGGERLDRTKEGWPVLIGLRLSGLATMVLGVAALCWPTRFGWASVDLPECACWCGAVVCVFSELWLLWMLHSLGRNLTDTVVTRSYAKFVCAGPYRFVRNPMYTGVLLLAVGIGLAIGVWTIPVTGAIVFAFLAVRTRTEERFLVERFGEQYLEYMKRTPRFFPGL